MESLLVNVGCFSIGYVFGISTKKIVNYIRSKAGKPLLATSKSGMRTFISIAVVIIWVVTITVGILDKSYKVDPVISGIMGSIVAYFFLTKDANNGKS